MKIIYRGKFTQPFFIIAFAVILPLFSCTRKEDPEFSGMVFIPGGEFIRGTEDVDVNSFGKDFGTREEKLFESAKPRRKIFLKGFYIDKYEVKNEDFERYVMQTGILPPPTWEDKGKYYPGREKHPVNAIDWYTADRYCKWAGKRLPDELEWEKAARGPNGNKYPWGNVFELKNANLDMQDTVGVGSIAGDKSYYGVYDMAGNVAEWTSSWYAAYPGSVYKSRYFGEKYKVVKGGTGSVVGHYNMAMFDALAFFRIFYPPDGLGVDVGFRCAKDLDHEKLTEKYP